MSVPYWVQDAVFYQIFPDRFANGDPKNDPPNVQAWGSPPTTSNFMGGDLRGIINHFDYLLDLGINCIYLNPIFHSPSNHRYNTSDYYKIDPKLGDMRDFKALLENAHQNNIRVILDGVFNHCGRGFFAFVDVLENQQDSAYKDWYHIKQFPVEAYTPGEATDYLAWWKIKSLPKFNTDNQQVRKYILDVARYWIAQGADGWRLDVPNEIDDDGFWGEFRQAVKEVNPDAYLVGEIWDQEPRWVGDDHFDGLMNYPVRKALLDVLTSSSADMSQFASNIESNLRVYKRENTFAMFVPMGSHDTERLLTILEGDIGKAKLAFLFQFAFPGAPAIYYGDEIGMMGGKDPGCRGSFPWDRNQWDTELHAWLKQLIVMRKRLPVLRRGNYQQILVDNRRRFFAFARTLGDSAVLVLLNLGATRRHVRIKVDSLGWEDGRILHSLLEQEELIVSGDSATVTIPPWSGKWFT
ncbi:MAG: glycoside hydrolase family 13 protein [Anaerolineales bacterium]|nr:MAG: glycoside hydrolase family 13 protein [Anaerolineales bacterium]